VRKEAKRKGTKWEKKRNKMGEGKEQNGRRKGTKWERKRNKKEKESNTI